MDVRYFIVFYMGYGVSGKTYQGHIDIKCNPFLNKQECYKVIKESNQHLSSVIMTSFNEISQSDYECWKQESK